ncbi:Tetratricopeptide-like helical [Penicillium freii]|nr:Tetratricopeptide-like helical [Penicillium freii]
MASALSLASTSLLGLRPTLDVPEQDATMTKEKSFSQKHQKVTRKSTGEDTTLADLVHSLARRGSDDLAASRVSDTDYASLLEWIRSERMRKLPPEGSGYDKALVWAALFIERVHSFDLGIEQFAGDSHLAAQLSYGHCMSLLELGEENARALMDLFGFFYCCSDGLGNLLDRAELFVVSSDIKDQLILALADLVTLVVCVARHFHRSLLASELVSIDIYSTFPGPIDSFRGRCEHVSELMWRHQLTREGFDGDKAVGINILKRWLQPEDPVVADASEATVPSAQEREEATCMWVKPYLTRFLKGDEQVLSVTGKPGSDGRIPANTTPSAVAKTIMSQMFSKCIGNLQLYQILADAYNQSKRTVDEEAYDGLLWNALGSVLQISTAGGRELVLIVDGVDEASCGEKVLLHRLREVASKAPRVKLIILASQAIDSAISQVVVRVTLGLIFDDIAAVVRKILDQSHAYNNMSNEDKEVAVTRITEASDGSFVWAKLAAKRVRDEHLPNEAALSKSVESISQKGYKIFDLISHTLQSKLGEDTKKILVWLATANRPLAQQELAALLAIQPDKAVVTEQRNVDLPHLLKPVASLIFFYNSFVYLRHAMVRIAIIDIFSKGKFLLEIKDRHVDLTQRLLLYVKQTATDNHEPSLDSLNGRATEHLFEKHPLLDFALRYWPGHAKIAFGCTRDQELTTASKSLRSVFPTSSSVPLLEMTVWASKATPLLRSIHGIQTTLYRQILSIDHSATLQAIICQALFYRQICDIVPAESSQIFYEAAKISQKVLSVRHLITMQMAQFFLEATVDHITESKTDVMTRRIEILQLLVECQKVHHGATSDIVKVTLTQLSEHYTLVKENRRAQEINASLEEFFVDSTTQRSGSRRIDESLLVHLHGRKHPTETSTILELDGIEEDELITLSFDMKTLLNQAERQRAEGHLADAECTYVELWQQASQAYRLNHSTEQKVSMLRTVLEYAQYLKSRERDNEAASILAGFWEEYEKTTPSAESLVPHLLEIAQVMKSVGLSVLALEVFKHCAQSTSRQSATHKEVEKHIKSTSREVMRSSSTNSLLTESTLKEMIYNRAQDSTTATTTLVEMYLSQHRWHDATSVLKRVLRDVWPAMFAPSIEKVVLPSVHVQYCVELAERLASCYRYRCQPFKEEDIRARLYSAVWRDRSACGDQILERVTLNLLRLYERTSQTDKAIKIHQDILHDYTMRLGGEHPTVIQKLWILADLTSPQPIAVDYYCRIIQFLNKGSETCHPAAFEPLIIVATELLKQNRHADALKPCQMLFAALKTPQISQKLSDPGFVQTVYKHYVHCLRETHSDISTIHDVTVQYRKSCISLFGASASITIQATNTLANICQESKQFEAEAVQLYEELLQIKSSEVEIDRQDIRATLDTIYEQQSASLTASKVDSMSATELQKVLSIRTQRLTSIRSSYGWAHEEALSQMEEVVSVYTQQGKSQAAVSLLHEAATHVLSTETSSIKLTAAAKSIASGYIAAGQIQKAKELANEIYLHVIVKDTMNTSAFGFDHSSKGRLSLIFLAQLEYSIREPEGNSATLNEVYATLTTEYIYFEQFREALGSKTGKFQDTTATVARLHTFLLSRGRHSAATQVVDRYTNFFLASEGTRLDIDHNQAKVFIETMLEYFSTHVSQGFVRSVAIASYSRASQLLQSEDYQSACQLALAAAKYISASHGYSSQATLKLVFKLGLLIAGRENDVRPTVSAKKYMAKVSATILRDTLRYLKEHNVDLAQLDVENVNSLIKVLDKQHDYHTLAWVLTSLWNSRETHTSSQPQHAYTLALGRMLVITRYLISDYTAAVRLAEDLVYNCARVHGPRHPSTVEMTVLLSQMYTSMAQGYQNQKGRRELAYRYYRKAAALHENALRVFIGPSSDDADMEVISGISSPSSASSPGEKQEEGKHVRQHLHMLKLAVERLGEWPKEYSEYERLNHDIFSTFANDLEGVDGVDKWNVQSFGAGKAEASDDLIFFSHEHLAIPV